jgi:hypothetical protein
MRTFATVGFIAAVAAGAIYLAQRPTIARGDVMAAQLSEQFEQQGVTLVRCDREIPITVSGAVFECTLEGPLGTTTAVFTMARDGSIEFRHEP